MQRALGNCNGKVNVLERGLRKILSFSDTLPRFVSLSDTVKVRSDGFQTGPAGAELLSGAATHYLDLFSVHSSTAKPMVSCLRPHEGWDPHSGKP
jgi:hypothetical protein